NGDGRLSAAASTPAETRAWRRSEASGETAALVDGALGVQLRRYIGATDHVHGLAAGLQRGQQFPARLLACADHHVADWQGLLLAIHADAQAGIVHTQVLDSAEHMHALGLERGPMDPAGGLAQ